MTLRETPPSTGLTSSSQTTLQVGTNSFQFYRWGCIVPRISSFQTQDFRHTVVEAAPSACPMRLLIVPTSQGSTEMSKATVISPFSSQCWKTPVSTPHLACYTTLPNQCDPYIHLLFPRIFCCLLLSNYSCT